MERSGLQDRLSLAVHNKSPAPVTGTTNRAGLRQKDFFCAPASLSSNHGAGRYRAQRICRQDTGLQQDLLLIGGCPAWLQMLWKGMR